MCLKNENISRESSADSSKMNDNSLFNNTEALDLTGMDLKENRRISKGMDVANEGESEDNVNGVGRICKWRE